jgi:patatin-related protein
MTEQMDGIGRSGSSVRELRLAVVCYGGVSLAIYMHGVTKEIQKLVRASAALANRPGQDNPFQDGTEKVYFDLLSRIAQGKVGSESAGVTIRVVVDIISGTSAGGINGVFLAKALAQDRSQEALKKLWFEKGDIKQLLRGRRWIPAKLRGAWLALGVMTRPLTVKPPLRGDAMCEWLHDALKRMDDDPALPQVGSLLPDDAELQLFVPITDFHGYNQDIPLYDPRFVSDRTHRHVMHFRHQSGKGGDFGEGSNHMLAFSARATSSFPGAFPPISFDTYGGCIPGGADLASTGTRFFPLQTLAKFKPEDTWFIDGGALNNFPFRSAVDAIPARPASCDVDRRLLYIEPDPVELPPPKRGSPAPNILRTVFGGFAGIPRREPILDDLFLLNERNEAVLRVRDVIESGFETMRQRVDDLMEEAETSVLLSRDASGQQVTKADAALQERALSEAGFSAPTYLRLRIRLVVDRYAKTISDICSFPVGSWQASFVTGALRHWAVDEGFLEQKPDEEQRTRQRALLSALDLQYHERRIRFLISAMSWLYSKLGEPGVPERRPLDEGKHRLYRRLDALGKIVAQLVADPQLGKDLEHVFSAEEMKRTSDEDAFEIAEFVDRHRQQLLAVRRRAEHSIAEQLPPILAGAHQDVMDFLEACGDELRRDVRTRYLGFPFWDILVYPLQAMSGVGERDHVEVYRISPREIRLLKLEGKDGSPLQGVSLFHFGAFFSREGREGDYLWGRLHAAERLIKLLLDARRQPSTSGTPAEPHADPGWDLAAECAPAFRAILVEEHSLEHASKVLEAVSVQLENLGS